MFLLCVIGPQDLCPCSTRLRIIPLVLSWGMLFHCWASKVSEAYLPMCFSCCVQVLCCVTMSSLSTNATNSVMDKGASVVVLCSNNRKIWMCKFKLLKLERWRERRLMWILIWPRWIRLTGCVFEPGTCDRLSLMSCLYLCFLSVGRTGWPVSNMENVSVLCA